MTKIIEPVGVGPGVSEKDTNAPAFETDNARLEQVGAFRRDNIGADLADTAMTFQGVDAVAPTGFPAGRAGTIVGVVAYAREATTAGPITAGDLTLNATVGGAQVGEELGMDDGSGAVEKIEFATPVEFEAEDLLGIDVGSVGLTPTTTDVSAYLLIRWSPQNAG